MNDLAIIDFKSEVPIELGNSYRISTAKYGQFPLDVTEATCFEDFDSTYYYAGNDLGANYCKNETAFVLWAPLASKVRVKYKKNPEDVWNVQGLKRCENGVYKGVVKGDLDGYIYLYDIINNEVLVTSTDLIKSSCLSTNLLKSFVFI